MTERGKQKVHSGKLTVKRRQRVRWVWNQNGASELDSYIDQLMFVLGDHWWSGQCLSTLQFSLLFGTSVVFFENCPDYFLNQVYWQVSTELLLLEWMSEVMNDICGFTASSTALNRESWDVWNLNNAQRASENALHILRSEIELYIPRYFPLILVKRSKGEAGRRLRKSPPS